MVTGTEWIEPGGRGWWKEGGEIKWEVRLTEGDEKISPH
jgi:hypothetical protein